MNVATAVDFEYSFPRYLAAKKSVDDRALNREVWRQLVARAPRGQEGAPVRILEVGAGIGTMVERVMEWGLVDDAVYSALDALLENTQAARERLPSWADWQGLQITAPDPDHALFHKPGKRLFLEWVTGDVFDFIVRYTGKRQWDLLIAHAFLDLMNLPTLLPGLFSLLRPGGLFYFTLNFDGATLFEPELDPALDDLIQAVYHRTMDERVIGGKPSGDSRTGRRLFGHLRQAGARILVAGASDWVVFAGEQGYPADEGYFLHFILETVRRALQGRPELEPLSLDRWVAERRAQVERGELVYIAHQIDFLGCVP